VKAVLILAAFGLDLLLGDPRWLPHPVVLIGRVIARGEEFLRRSCHSPAVLLGGGLFLVLLVVGGTFKLAQLLLALLYGLDFYLGALGEIFLLYTCFAAKGLREHALAVARPLKEGDLAAARRKIALIVGRDTQHLDAAGITRAAVESVAENTVDGVISPLFYAFLGGAPLALAFKAVSTMDSMIGYRDEHYLYLGRAAAKLDDLANYLPARLTGLIFLLLAPFTPGGVRGVWRTIRRDAPKHPSPNGGIPEAAVAGALKIKLGGLNYYFGQPAYRAEMGDGEVPLNVKHIEETVRLMYAAAVFTLVAGTVAWWLIA